MIANGKACAKQARSDAYGSASALSKYGINGNALAADEKGMLKMSSFTLENVSGGYSLAYDASTSEFKISKQGVDITAAFFAGTAFR